MGIISSALGTTTGLLSTIIGAISASRNRKKQEKTLNEELSKNEDLFKKQYYQNILDRSDTASLLHNYREALKRQNEARQNRAVVTGATPEALAAQKKIDAKTYSDVISNISDQSSQLKDNALQQYQANYNYLMGQKAQLYARQALNRSQLASNGFNILADSLNNLGQSIDQYKSNKLFSNLF